MHESKVDVCDFIARNLEDRGRDPDAGVDVLNPADYFVGGHALGGSPKPQPEKRGVSTTDRILRKHRSEDWTSALTEKRVDQAIAAVKRGRRAVTPEQFESVARYVFADFARQRREALRTGRVRLGDGTTIIRLDAKAEAA